jgi:hypothetical protein
VFSFLTNSFCPSLRKKIGSREKSVPRASRVAGKSRLKPGVKTNAATFLRRETTEKRR